MAIEYAGFVPTETRINWADLTEDLAGKVYQIGEKREKAKAELDQIAADNQAMLNAWRLSDQDQLFLSHVSHQSDILYQQGLQ